MLDILFWITVFIISLIVLIKSADQFTESAEKIGLHFGIPAFIIGVTIVSLGTSLPEIISSMYAVFKDSSEFVVGNVVGSNTANILLVLGTASIVTKKIKVTYEIVHVDLPFLVGSTFLLAFTCYDGYFTFLEGIICLLVLSLYFNYAIHVEKSRGGDELEEDAARARKKLSKKTWISLLVSSFFIYLGAKFTVDSVIVLSSFFNIGKELIAVTAVAIGTSLPELSVTLGAARKGKAELAVGNVLGSNIVNSMGVMGLPSLFGTLTVPETMLSFGIPMMVATSILYFMIAQDKQITKWEGWFMVIFYIFFIGTLLGII